MRGAMTPAVFLDRDGVLIENREEYVLSWKDVDILPGACEAMRRLAALPYPILLVTNQSAIGRGLVSHKEVNAINDKLVDLLRASGGRVDGVYLCPHAPETVCSCRKPAPGMLLDAAREHDLKLDESYLIGDAVTDLLAGQAAGLQHLVLVRTGRGADQAPLLAEAGLDSTPVYPDLLAAVQDMFP